MKTHLSNAAYGVLDFASYPIGMLLAAPVVLRNLGFARYGVWAVATAAVSTGAIIAAGFGDANIQHVASRRGDGGHELALRAVRLAGRFLLLRLLIWPVRRPDCGNRACGRCALQAC
jgi:O-antigen/teichoic acid export membrane protein